MIIIVSIVLTIILGVFIIISGKFIDVFSKKPNNPEAVFNQAINDTYVDYQKTKSTLENIEIQLEKANLIDDSETVEKLTKLYDETKSIYKHYEEKLFRLQNEKEKTVNEWVKKENLHTIQKEVENLKNKFNNDDKK